MVTKPSKRTKNAVNKFMVLKNVLHRLHQSGQEVTKQVVLPTEHRDRVVKLAHSSQFGGHMGIQKTLACIQKHFYWPDISSEVKSKCRSCVECQTTRPEGKFPKATIQTIDMPYRPFEKVAIDIIGSLSVPSEER